MDLHTLVLGVHGQARHDRGAEARGDHALHGAVVVGAEDEAERVRRVAFELPEAAAVAEADQVVRRRGGERRLARLLGVRREDEHVGIAQELDVLERAIRQRQVGEGQVEVAALDVLEQGDVGGRLVELDLDPRPRLDEALHQRREQVLADALVDADAQRAGLAVRERLHVGLRGGETRDDRLGVAEQELAGLGQRHAPRPARALDELLPDDPLERRDLLADRRLRVAERRGGAAERRLTRDGLQRDQVAKLHAEPTIRFHDGKVSDLDLC